ncbi:MAG: isochorismate synthase [Actinobacteria bacterium]|uniref:isochorismate synthase n=1 Tax=freshwater metagenome TaxID=449393 RepID=A0A6J6HAD3_9ZZZZ|nr:isochorismate synthase [Actinomycetota bacterium]
MSALITTEILGEHPSLTSIATEFDVSTTWIRGDEGLVGFGVYKKYEVSGEDRFKEAHKWWQQILSEFTIQNNVHGIGTGPILFTSFAFDPKDTSELIIPKIIIGQRNGKSWITWIGDQKQPEIKKIEISPQSGEITWANGTVEEEKWRNQVSKAIDAIKSGRLEKVVLARDLKANSTTKIDLNNLLQKLEIEYPSTWVFLVDGLVGATPELLVRLNKSLITSRVLAGTIQKTGNEDRDLALAASLAKSSKDLEEHEYAVKSVADSLAPFCSSTNVPESPFVLHLSNVMHLATDVTGVLNDSAKQADIFTLIENLHPTAAVCGTPTNVAKKLISELETMNRSRYAGPVGWIDAQGDGEIAIALRCGELSDDYKSIRIFAGCGIVAGSDPITEYAESQAKLMPMRTALETL